MITRSLSDKRILLDVDVNGHKSAMLLDTGASVSMIDESKAQSFGFHLSATCPGVIQGAGGEVTAHYVRGLTVRLAGIKMWQFIAADISCIVDSIRCETGIEICGVIGLPQMKAAEIKIYPASGIVKIGF